MDGQFVIERVYDEVSDEVKVCSKCGKVLPVTEFHMQRKQPNSSHRHPTCKVCRRAEQNAEYARIKVEDPDKWEEIKRKRRERYAGTFKAMRVIPFNSRKMVPPWKAMI